MMRAAGGGPGVIGGVYMRLSQMLVFLQGEFNET
jgi:hypothetical protein